MMRRPISVPPPLVGGCPRDGSALLAFPIHIAHTHTHKYTHPIGANRTFRPTTVPSVNHVKALHFSSSFVDLQFPCRTTLRVGKNSSSGTGEE